MQLNQNFVKFHDNLSKDIHL